MKLPQTGSASALRNEPLPALENLHGLSLSPAADHSALAALLLGTAVLALFAQVLFSGTRLVSTPEGDLANQFLGWRAFGFSELKRGHLALWNPYIFCGAPYFAGFQSALLYPPNAVFLFLPLIFALNFSFALHVFLAGFFTYLWLASHRLAFLPALFGAFVFMFGGAFFAHVYPGHLPNLCAMAWIPLVFWVVEKLIASPGFKSLLLGAGVLSLQLLAGHPQYFLYTLLFACIYGSILLLKDPARRSAKLLWGLGAGLFAAGLTAIQWLPGLEAAREFGRAIPSGLETLDFYSLHFPSLLSMVAPAFFYAPELYTRLLGSRLWWESCLFIGVPAFLWILTSLGDKETGQAAKWIPFGLALTALLLALGPRTPLYPLLAKVPLFGDFRGSFKFVIFFQLFSALLAAQGLQTFLVQKEPDKKTAYGSLGLSLLLFMSALYLWLGDSSMNPQSFLKEWALSLAVSAGLFLILGLLGLLRNGMVKTGMALFAMAQLFTFAYSNLDSFNADPLRQETIGTQEKIRNGLGDGRIYWEGHNNKAMLLGVPSIWGDDPFPSFRYQAFVQFHKSAAPTPKTAPDVQVLNLTPVKMELTRLAFLLSNGDKTVNVTPSPAPRLPRFSLIGKFHRVQGFQEALDALEEPRFDPVSQVILEQDPQPPPAATGAPGRVSVTIHDTDHLEFQVQIDKPRILFMTDSYASGWKAVGRPDSSRSNYQVLPGDGFARAIPLAAGDHHFDLVYDPPGFALGKGISLAALPCYLLAWAGWFWRRKGMDPWT